MLHCTALYCFVPRHRYGYNVAPRLDDRVHALALCVPCWAVGDAGYMAMARRVWEQCVERGGVVMWLDLAWCGFLLVW